LPRTTKGLSTPRKNKVRIRQGVTGHNVRYVLFASCALVILLFILVAIFVRP